VLLRRAVATKQRQQRELAARVQEQQQTSGGMTTAAAPHFAKLDKEVAQWQAEADTQKQILVSMITLITVALAIVIAV
jgi:uncharacterized glyoxalase superfamily metalloenzyme YdcJ